MMGKIIRLVVTVLVNLITFPLQLAIFMVFLATKWREEQLEEICDWCDEANSAGKQWLKYGPVD